MVQPQAGALDGALAYGHTVRATLHPPAFGGRVLTYWAQHALLWFQRSQLPLLALCSRA